MPSLTRLVSLLSTLALLAFSQVFAQSDADVHITPRTSMERPIHRSSDAPAPPDSEPALSTRIKSGATLPPPVGVFPRYVEP